MDLSLNECLVTPSINTYPYGAYLWTLLSYGQLTAALLYWDQASHMEKVDENDGFVERRQWIQNSKYCVLFGRPHLKLCFQDCVLLHGVEMKLRLVRSKVAFSLIGSGKVVFKDVALLVRKVKLNPAVQLAHVKALDRSTTKYSIQRVQLKVFSVLQGNMSFTKEKNVMGSISETFSAWLYG